LLREREREEFYRGRERKVGWAQYGGGRSSPENGEEKGKESKRKE